MTIVLVLITFIIERTITLTRAKGKGRLNSFVSELQADLASDKIEEAMDKLATRQRGFSGKMS